MSFNDLVKCSQCGEFIGYIWENLNHDCKEIDGEDIIKSDKNTGADNL